MLRGRGGEAAAVVGVAERASSRGHRRLRPPLEPAPDFPSPRSVHSSDLAPPTIPADAVLVIHTIPSSPSAPPIGGPSRPTGVATHF